MKRYTQEEIRQSVQTIADAYLSMYETIRDPKTVTVADDTVIQKLRKMGFPQQGRPLDNVVGEMLEDVCTNQALLQHPRFFAFVPSPASPLSWVGDVLTDAYNPHGGTWMESSAASCLEQETIQWLCQQAGYPQTAGGLFVSGGSIANLTALAAARHAMLTETEYSSGVAYLSEQTHFSIIKALRIMGLTKEQIRMIPCDDHLRMDALQLEQAILQDEKSRKKSFIVIATAGTTNTGCIDPLSQIADICRSHRLWFHVDGAYGASVLVSKKYRHLLEDVSRVDSFVWDAHKWLFQTYACSTVLFRDKKYLAAFYSSDPEYLRDAAAENGEINYWEWGIELTRPARSLKLWLTLQTLGDRSDQRYGDPRHRLGTAGGVHASEPAGVGDRNTCAAGHCEFSLCAAGAFSTAAGRTQHSDFSTHDGGMLCLRADHPAERPDRSADLLDPPGDNRRRGMPYDTASGQICPCIEDRTLSAIFLNHAP